MQIEQVVGAVVERPQLARAREVRASCRGPSSTSAVHRRLKSSSTQRDANGSAAIERPVRGDVGEARPSACRAAGASPREQPVERDRAADLVAVRQRLQQYVRARALRGERPDVRECRRCRRPSGRDRETRPRSAAGSPPRRGIRGARPCVRQSTQTRSASRRMNASQRASWSTRHPFVRLVRLRDVARAADDRRDRRRRGTATPRCRTTPCRCSCGAVARAGRARRSRCRRACRSPGIVDSASNSMYVCRLRPRASRAGSARA